MELRMGVYRHYKGHLYQVIGLGHDANADTLGDEIVYDESAEALNVALGIRPLGERVVVLYFALQLDAAHEGPRLAVRTLKDFEARLHVTNASLCECKDLDPDTMPRFEYLGPYFTKEMLD